MKSYFINESRGLRARLNGAQIPFALLSIDGQNGVVLEQDHLSSVLTLLRSHVERKEQSTYDGIEILHLRRNSRDTQAASPVVARITVSHNGRFSSSEQMKKIVSVAREFEAIFGVEEIIIYDNDDGNEPRPTQADVTKLYVNFWCSCRGSSQHGENSAAVLWGHQISDERGHWRIWRPSRVRGSHIIIDDAGTEVAEVVGNNIYVLYPITDERVRTTPEIFRKILEEAYLLLGGNSEEIAKRRLEEENRRKAALEAEMRANPVVIKKWNGFDRHREKFIAVAKDFVAAFGGKQIRIYDYCGDTRKHPPSTDGRVDICIWTSSNSLDSGGKMQQTLFGAPLEVSDNQVIIAPSGETGLLLTDEDGNQFGKLMGDTLYIHYPITNRHVDLKWDGKGPETLFRRMLEEVVFLKTATNEQKAERIRMIAVRHRAQSREAYATVCNRRFDRDIDRCREVVNNNPEKTREHGQAIVRLIRECREAQAKLANMESSRAEAVEAYAREFDKLVEVPKVVDVRVSDSIIKVFTEVLYCVDERTGKRHEIGAFRIEINPDMDIPVRWFNLTRRVNGYKSSMHAPHVFPDGNACLGNMAEVIPQLVADYEFAALAMICIQFVESANIDDPAGRYINKWPLAV